jgi:lysophospholipase L1-like esterase
LIPARVLRLAAAAICAGLAACGGPSERPGPVAELSITCPGNRSVESQDGSSITVSFDTPVSAGGTAPVSTSCTPQSGSQFPVGNTTINCQARDSANHVAGCSFTVAVQAAPRLSATRFLAFGDSITAGVVSNPLGLMIVSPPQSYPYVLQDRLVARYRQQTPVVLNEGNAAELASVEGIQRFRGVLLASRPEVVLLMEGSNDLGFATANAAISALRSMLIEARSQNVRVGLATIPPMRSGGFRRRDAVAVMIPGFNDRVRGLAAAEGVPLIDVYNGMKDDLSLIGDDDLHPTPRGYDVMAGIFFEAIRANFEAKPALAWRTP